MRFLLRKKKSTENDTSLEAEAFRFAINQLSYLTTDTKVIVFQINGSNRGHCNLIDKLADNGSGYFETRSGLHIEVVQVCDLLSDSDFFILDDHMNASGHAKVAKALLSKVRK